MGARFWSYFVSYQESLEAALEELRETEFREGRFYQPSETRQGFFDRVLRRSPSKPKRPKSIREAIKFAGATGTRSILDMERISAKPEYNAAWCIPESELQRLLGTSHPARETVNSCEELLEMLDRGQGVAVVTYRGEIPDGIYFAGYSFD